MSNFIANVGKVLNLVGVRSQDWVNLAWIDVIIIYIKVAYAIRFRFCYSLDL